MGTFRCTECNRKVSVKENEVVVSVDAISNVNNVNVDPEMKNKEKLKRYFEEQKEKMKNVEKSKITMTNKIKISRTPIKRKKQFTTESAKKRMKDARDTLDEDEKNKLRENNKKQMKDARDKLDEDEKNKLRECDTKQRKIVRDKLDEDEKNKLRENK